MDGQAELEKEVKEVQETIIPVQQSNGKVSEEEFFSILKIIAPGTSLRTALDGALRIGHGALIVLETEQLIPLLDGGFRVNCRFTPQRLIELTKMDGAIILLQSFERIIAPSLFVSFMRRCGLKRQFTLKPPSKRGISCSVSRTIRAPCPMRKAPSSAVRKLVPGAIIFNMLKNSSSETLPLLCCTGIIVSCTSFTSFSSSACPSIILLSPPCI